MKLSYKKLVTLITRILSFKDPSLTFGWLLAFVFIFFAFSAAGKANNEVNPTNQTQESTLGIADENNFAFVTRVIDGDTIEVRTNNELQKIRLIGIDAPETGSGNTTKECFSEEATKELASLILQKNVVLHDDPTQDNQDRYGRLLRYVSLPDGTNINRLLILKGFANEYTYRVPYQLQKEFQDAEDTAEIEKLGLWSPLLCPQLSQ